MLIWLNKIYLHNIFLKGGLHFLIWQEADSFFKETQLQSLFELTLGHILSMKAKRVFLISV